MKQKWPLFLGILLLTLGIILKKTTQLSVEPMVIMTLGVALKVYYIADKARKGLYHAGYELVALMIGLLLFFTGIYFKNNDPEMPYLLLMISGIALKVFFIVVFIRKTRRTELTSG